MPFRPGFLTAADADRLNRLERQVAAAQGTYFAPPFSTTRGTDGRVAVSLDLSDGGFWAEITGSGGTPVAYSWKQKVLSSAFAWVDASPSVTGTTNAYPVAGSAAAVAPAVGDPVRMWPSATGAGKYEFQVFAGQSRAGSGSGAGGVTATIPQPVNIRCDTSGRIVWDLEFHVITLNPDGTLSQEVIS